MITNTVCSVTRHVDPAGSVQKASPKCPVSHIICGIRIPHHAIPIQKIDFDCAAGGNGLRQRIIFHGYQGFEIRFFHSASNPSVKCEVIMIKLKSATFRLYLPGYSKNADFAHFYLVCIPLIRNSCNSHLEFFHEYG